MWELQITLDLLYHVFFLENTIKFLRISALLFYSTTRKAEDKQKSTSKISVLDPFLVDTLLLHALCSLISLKISSLDHGGVNRYTRAVNKHCNESTSFYSAKVLLFNKFSSNNF